MKKLKNIKWSRHFNIRTRLIIAFVFILIIPTIIISVTSYQTAKNKIEEQMIGAAEENVTLLDELLQNYIQSKVGDVKLISDSISAEEITAEREGSNIGVNSAVSMEIDRYQKIHPEVEAVVIGTDTGLSLLSNRDIKLPPDFDPRTRSWYTEAVAQPGEVIVTSPYVSQGSGNLVVTLAATTADGSGVAAVDILMNEFQTIAGSVKIGNEGYVYILDENRNYVVHPTAEIGTEALKNVQNDNLYLSHSGTFEYIFKDGTPKKMAFVTNELTGWKLAGTFSVSEINDESSTIVDVTMLVLGISFVVGILLIFLIIRSIHRPLKTLVQISKKVSEGDLTQKLQLNSHDELGQLGTSFNGMIESLLQLITEVNDKSEQLAAASQQLAAGAEQSSKTNEQISDMIQQVAEGTESQVGYVEKTSGVIGSLDQSAQQIVEQTQQAADVSVDASQKSEKGRVVIEEVVRQMETMNVIAGELSNEIEQLGKQSREIGEITGVITGIANQTNMLALNASIEAARAGEHGKGFAVVASEVRKLAEQTTGSADQISELIGSIQNRTQKAVESVQMVTSKMREGKDVAYTAGTSFADIQQRIFEVSGQLREVSASSKEMTEEMKNVVTAIDSVIRISEQTSAGMQNVSASTEEQLAASQEITASANSLSKMAEQLQEVISKFKI
ncbi:methyl-accepting chemotaxis protein [Marinicrinis lubricantis]|uniref:Methyl-accepting chemotaxis protein n=1 Tax=Marinicrinis lubricantis TaxID=2086470 RepID=A0ABW1IJJ9_9BACL